MMENNQVKLLYPEIVRCLTYASRTKVINEAESIREILLSVLAPVLASMTESTTQEQINSIMRNILSDRSNLFKLEVVKKDADQILKVDLNSKILEIEAFPFEIRKSDNIISTVNLKLGLPT